MDDVQLSDTFREVCMASVGDAPGLFLQDEADLGLSGHDHGAAPSSHDGEPGGDKQGPAVKES